MIPPLLQQMLAWAREPEGAANKATHEAWEDVGKAVGKGSSWELGMGLQEPQEEYLMKSLWDAHR